jgi:hypothetical protein
MSGLELRVFCGLRGCGVGVDNGMCSRCKAIVYCSKAHQREDWRRHKEACREIAAARREETEAAKKFREDGARDLASTPPISSEDLNMLREKMGDTGLQSMVEFILKQGLLASNRQEVLKGLAKTGANVKEAEKKRKELGAAMPGGIKGCAECGRRARGQQLPQRCTGCYMAIYCSKACSEAAWPGHKAACREVRAQYRPVLINPPPEEIKNIFVNNQPNNEPKSHLPVRVTVDEKTGFICVINKNKTVCGQLERSTGQEEVYDKLLSDVPKQGVKQGVMEGTYQAFYYALDGGTSEKRDRRLQMYVEKPVAMELWG